MCRNGFDPVGDQTFFCRDVIYWLGLLHNNNVAREQPVQAQTYRKTPPWMTSITSIGSNVKQFFGVWRAHFRRSDSIFCLGSSWLLQREDRAVELPFYLASDSCSFRWVGWEEPPRLHVLTHASAPVCLCCMTFSSYFIHTATIWCCNSFSGVHTKKRRAATLISVFFCISKLVSAHLKISTSVTEPTINITEVTEKPANQTFSSLLNCRAQNQLLGAQDSSTYCVLNDQFYHWRNYFPHESRF